MHCNWIIVGFCIQLCHSQVLIIPAQKQCEMTPVVKYPYTAHVMKRGTPYCMGIIMSKQVIITTAQCTMRENDDDEKYYKVYTASSRLGQRDAYDVCDLRPHPYSHTKGSHMSYYDIGLIILKNFIRFGKLVSIANFLPETKKTTDKPIMTIVSFGFSKKKKNPEQRLCVTNTRYIDQPTCNRTLIESQHAPLRAQLLCMAPTTDCYADPGSAVTWNGYVVGMVVTDMKCDSKTSLSIFLDVTYFKTWIGNNIHELQPSNCSSIRKLKKRFRSFEGRENEAIHETEPHNDWTINIIPRYD